MSNNDCFLKQHELHRTVLIRYGRDLYHNFDRNDAYHFVYAYKRFLFEITKTILALLTAPTTRQKTDSISLYATNNQRAALLKAKAAGHIDGEIIPISILSRRALALRLLIWLAKLFVYPIQFINSQHRPGLYQTCLLSGMMKYISIFASRLDELGVRRLFISNDHAGDVFLLSIITREKRNLTVSYIQHGAAKPEFPENHFHKIYVYNNSYADIYRSLARNANVEIFVEPSLEGTPDEDLAQIDLLVCFSHQFPLWASISLAVALRKTPHIRSHIRFHPSDRFGALKLGLMRIIYPFELSDNRVGYRADFARAKLVLCASSSLLPDAIECGFKSKIVWARQLGLSWDYYGLEGRIREVSSTAQVMRILPRS